MIQWPQVPLGELGVWRGGGTPSKTRPDFWEEGTIPWLSPKDMCGQVVRATRDHITPSALDLSPAKLVAAGSVAVVVRSGILERTIPVSLVPFATALNQDMKALSPRPDVDARWIAWGLRAFESQLLRTARKAGTTVASLEWSRVLNYPLPLPPLDEQRRIVDILEDHLSRLDAAERALNTAAHRLRILKFSTLESLMSTSTDEHGPLRDLVNRIEAGRSFGGSAGPADLDGWGIIKVSAMTWGSFRPTENKAVPEEMVDLRYEIRPGDLLVSRANTSAYVGASVLVGETRPRLLLSDKSLRIVPNDDVDSEWLNMALSTPSTRRQISARATGTKDSMRNISQGALLSLEIPHPPLAVQRAVANTITVDVHAFQQAASGVQTALTRSAALRRALLSAAFSGHLTGRTSDENRVEELAGV